MKIARGSSLHDLGGSLELERKATSVLDATLRVHRRTPIERLGTEALRFLLHEGESAAVVLRVALDRLEHDPFQSGDFHPGDLLAEVLGQRSAVWIASPDLRARAYALAEDAGNMTDLLEPEDRVIVERAIRNFKTRWTNGGAEY
jgi:hypothetical protein